MDYKICSMMLKGKIKKKINLEGFYHHLSELYSLEYNPDVTNRLIAHFKEASVLFFSSGTIQIYLKNPEKKDEVIEKIDGMLGHIYLVSPELIGFSEN
jgi:hypothetical protein